MKKTFSFILGVLILITAVLPLGIRADVNNTEEKVTTILAASDFQTKGASLSAGGSYDVFEASEEGADIVKNLMAQVTAVHSNIDGFLFGGDYAHGDSIVFNTAIGYTYLSEALYEGGLPEDADQFYIAGNHEKGLLGDENLDFFAQNGGHDMGDYGVYCINHDEYPYKEMDNEKLETITKNTADDLKAWLDTQQPGEKPIFVMSHLSLHYSTRTRNRNDGLYAKYIVDVLNEASERGLNIIFLYGHNHSGGYDTYMGGSTNFASKGDSIWVATPGEAQGAPSQQTIGFTYMNYGYLGYYESTSSDNEFTMTVFEIRGDDVTVYRYDQQGKHDVQACKGTFWNDSDYGYQPDIKTAPYGMTVYGGLYTVTLSDKSGVIQEKSALTTATGSQIILSWENGDQVRIDVTLDMLYQGEYTLSKRDVFSPTQLTDLIVKYEGNILAEDYVLTVEAISNEEPSVEPSVDESSETPSMDESSSNESSVEESSQEPSVGDSSVDEPPVESSEEETPTPDEPVKIPYGDVNGDDTIDATDALLALQGAVGKKDLTPDRIITADVSGDGKLDAVDALLILQLAVGKIEEFPVQQ